MRRMFVIDLPNHDERGAIWNLYLTSFELDHDQKLPDRRVVDRCRDSILLPATPSLKTLNPNALVSGFTPETKAFF